MKTLVKLDWQPEPKWRAWAENILQDVDSMIEDYITTCHAKGLKFANHDMAWKKWVERKVGWNPGLRKLPERVAALPTRQPEIPEIERKYPTRGIYKLKRSQMTEEQRRSADLWRADAINRMPEGLTMRECAEWIQREASRA